MNSKLMETGALQPSSSLLWIKMCNLNNWRSYDAPMPSPKHLIQLNVFIFQKVDPARVLLVLQKKNAE